MIYHDVMLGFFIPKALVDPFTILLSFFSQQFGTRLFAAFRNWFSKRRFAVINGAFNL